MVPALSIRNEAAWAERTSAEAQGWLQHSERQKEDVR